MERELARVRLMGGFAVAMDDGPVADGAWRLRKARALVKLLALAPRRRLHREQLAEAAVARARRRRAPRTTCTRRCTRARRRDGRRRAAAHRRRRHARGRRSTSTRSRPPPARARGTADPGRHARALELYGGELLPEDRYEPWTAARRVALRELHTRSASSSPQLTAATPAAAIAALQRAVAADPLHEPAHRALMAAYAAAGRRPQALAPYEQLRDDLRAELAAEPEPETRALYRELARRPRARRAGAARQPPAPARRSFVGRERELRRGRAAARAHAAADADRPRRRRQDAPGARGGRRARPASGPTASGSSSSPALGDAALVAQAVAAALGVRCPAQRSALDALAAHLAPRETLLVLDNCEHLAQACARPGRRPAARRARLRVLATSREPLRCAGEVAWRVPSLRRGRAAVRRARRGGAARVRASDADEQAPSPRSAGASTACRWRSSWPRRAWARSRSTRSPTRLDDASTCSAPAAARRCPASRRCARRSTGATTCSTARSACSSGASRSSPAASRSRRPRTSAPAARSSAGASPAWRRGWSTSRSCVAEGERLRLLETIRQYAAERLAARASAIAVALRHLDWCLALAERHDPRRRRPPPLAARLEREHDNLRAALAFALRRDPQAALRLAVALWRFWLVRGHFAEGARWLDAAIAARARATPLRGGGAARGRRARAAPRRQRRLPQPRAATPSASLGDERAPPWRLYQHAMFEQSVSSPAAPELVAARWPTPGAGGDVGLLAGDRRGALVRGTARDPRRRAARGPALALLEARPTTTARSSRGHVRALPLPDGPGGRPRLHWEETLFLFRRFARGQAIAYALNNLACRARRPATARRRAPRSTRRSRASALEDGAGEALTLEPPRQPRARRRRLEAGRAHLDAALAVRRELGDRRAIVAQHVASAGRSPRGDAGRAERPARRAARLAEAVDDLPGMAGRARPGAWSSARRRAPARRWLVEAGRAPPSPPALPRLEGWARLAGRRARRSARRGRPSPPRPRPSPLTRLARPARGAAAASGAKQAKTPRPSAAHDRRRDHGCTHDHQPTGPGSRRDDRRAARGLRGRAVVPGDPDTTRRAPIWNGTHDDAARAHRPVRRAGGRDRAGVARSEGLPIAVRGGGHSIPGFSTVDDGIVIDLSPDEAACASTPAHGARHRRAAAVADVDVETQAFGLALTGGLISTTGVGGFTLGGGIGWLMRSYGSPATTCVGADVVTADGRLVHASDDEHPDLFWGLRGGGGNFGIVTSFEFRAAPGRARGLRRHRLLPRGATPSEVARGCARLAPSAPTS